jgi:hypothetical protein
MGWGRDGRSKWTATLTLSQPLREAVMEGLSGALVWRV